MSYCDLCFLIGTTPRRKSNKKKHGVSFAEAATAFSDPNAIEVFDAKNADKEDRWVLVGFSSKAESYSSSLWNGKKNIFVLSRREKPSKTRLTNILRG